MAVNEDLTYVLVKHHTGEYFILAEKRLGEFISRDNRKGEEPFKVLLAFSGDTLSEMRVENPLLTKNTNCTSPGQLRVVIYNKVATTHGTGI